MSNGIDTRSSSIKTSTSSINNAEVDVQRLYESILKVIILEYSNEVRFRMPIYKPATAVADVSLPSNLLRHLKSELKSIALNKSKTSYDTLTKNSLLRFYSEISAPGFQIDMKPSSLVGKFAQCSTKIITTSNITDSKEINKLVSSQTITFVKIVIDLLKNDRNKDAIIAKFEESKRMLNPRQSWQVDASVEYLEPSYNINDMDPSMILLLHKLFSHTVMTIQLDINRLKGSVSSKAYHKDILSILNNENMTVSKFTTNEGYERYNENLNKEGNRLIDKYKIPDKARLIPLPKLTPGEEFYFLPPSSQTFAYYIKLIRLSLDVSQEEAESRTLLFSTENTALLRLIHTSWLIDIPTRAVALYTAMNTSNEKLNDEYVFDLENGLKIFDIVKKILQEGQLDTNDRSKWTSRDQNEWTKNLTLTYNKVALSIKNSIFDIYEKGQSSCIPYFHFLHEFIENDPLFPRVEATGLTKKWHQRLNNALLNLSIARYKFLFKKLPRDRKLEIKDLQKLIRKIQDDSENLSGKFPTSLVGDINVAKISTVITLAFFSYDSLRVLKNVSHYDTDILYELLFDKLSIYKTMKEMFTLLQRIIGEIDIKFLTDYFKIQIAKDNNKAYFLELYRSLQNPSIVIDRLESILFPVVSEYTEGMDTTVRDIVSSSIEIDDFLPDKDQKYSTSPKDIFKFITDLRSNINELGWVNKTHNASFYSSFLKAVSNGALQYSDTIMNKISDDLDNQDHDQNFKLRQELCVALNDLSKVMEYLILLDTGNTIDLSILKSEEDTNALKSHVFTIRVIRAENLMHLDASGKKSILKYPYVQLTDMESAKVVGKTRAWASTSNPEWDEEFEVTLLGNMSLKLALSVWDDKSKQAILCGRANKEIDPRKFTGDGTPQEFSLEIGTQGTVIIEVSVEDETGDAMFLMGKAVRSLKRSETRSVKLIVDKFLNSIQECISTVNLNLVCGTTGKKEPTEDEMESVLEPLKHYFNSNLEVLAQNLTSESLRLIIEATWNLVVGCIDELVLPKLTSSFSLQVLLRGSATLGLQGTISSAMAMASLSRNGKLVTRNELTTVFYWLESMKGFFESDVVDVASNEKYKSLLLFPEIFYKDTHSLMSEIEGISAESLYYDNDGRDNNLHRTPSAIGRIFRSRTIVAHATRSNRKEAATLLKNSKKDPNFLRKTREDMILRLLIARNEKNFVVRRLQAREKSAQKAAITNLALMITQTNIHK
ncbi:hypothetical protein DFJ63DRAFT_175978 [Scheffersomyces coipomensis]|uniref:uncharacterized protein n=1 Tax=Scheffersomyces coipomensis TaxID=1788519 RepID=UPI00315C609F